MTKIPLEEQKKLVEDAIMLTKLFRACTPEDRASRMTLLTLVATMVITDLGISNDLIAQTTTLLSEQITGYFPAMRRAYLGETLQ